MASAVLASQNESSWPRMANNPYSNSDLNTNPNPSPKKRQKQSHHAAATNGASAGRFHGNDHINNHDFPAAAQTPSGDAYSFNQKYTKLKRNAPNYGGYLSYRVAGCSKSELLDLRQRLFAELDQIRHLRDRIDSGVERQPKLKKLTGNKKPAPAIGSLPPKSFDALLKECGVIVAKLLKHKSGYIFKFPVDAAAMGLHDYHLIVKRPMDLGAVKANLANNLYRTPVDFADDVRLTFNNALLYNPENDPVNVAAGKLLSKFEELYRPLQDKLDSTLAQQRREFESHDLSDHDELQYSGFGELQGSSWNYPVNGGVNLSPMDQPPQVVEPLLPSPVRAPSVPMVKEPKVGRPGGTVKLPKPKAKDPNKRDMFMEEKQKLGMGLQSLPQEKMPQLVQIIRKKNHLAGEGDEIELDIEALDNETLWELDRFVTNWKKMVSKSKRQVLMNNPQGGGVAPLARHHPTSPVAYPDMGQMIEKNENNVGRKIRENDDEDVDIDDDTPADSFPPVEIERDEGVTIAVEVCQDQGQGQDHDNVNIQDRNDKGDASSSSNSSGSSSSGSSSSSDSDSGSSSGSDSDAQS